MDHKPQSRYLMRVLTIMVLGYAFLAGLRTVTDPDTGWQLASGRYIVEHHRIPSSDVFSYTARNRAWIYPPLSEILLYGMYLLGGFSALSWLNAAACTSAVGIALWAEGGPAAAMLAVLGIPEIALRTAPRADLFTTLFFASLLAVLWKHLQGRRAPLWIIPIILLVWVNTHPGFVSGLALIGAYLVIEVLNYPLAERRQAAILRLRRSAPWLLASLPATLVNPWGWKIYQALLQQEHELKIHESLIAEWRHIPLSAASLAQAFNWRNPHSSPWWLLAAVGVAALLALKRGALGPAVLLVGSAYLSMRNLRFQALVAIVAIVVAAPFLESLWIGRYSSLPLPKRRPVKSQPRRLGLVFTISIVTLAIGLTGIRIYDLFSQHAYIAAGDVTLFGAGLSTWYPERAADFILRQHLPANIFHDYNLGGYWLFRLGEQYPDYIDGRALPFADLIFEQRKLLKTAPDSAAWQQEADERGINTVVFGLARYWGLGTAPLAKFCTSQTWKPVYLDDVAVIFVRNTPANAEVINRLEIDCGKAQFGMPADHGFSGFPRGRAELFNYYANAGSVLYKLSRNAEAEVMLDRALQMFPEEPFLHHTRGQVYEASGRPEDAEREYHISAQLNPTDANWYSLSLLYSSQHRYAEAVGAAKKAAELSDRPGQYYVLLGTLRLANRQPQDALEAFDAASQAAEYSPPDARAVIESSVASGRAQAWANLGNLRRAIGFQQEALEMAPGNAQLWITLAELYRAQGRVSLEQEARQHAQSLSAPSQ